MWKFFKNLKIRGQMILALSITIFILLLSLFLIQYYEVQNSMKNEYVETLKEIASDKANEVTLWMGDKDLTELTNIKINEHATKHTDFTIADLQDYKIFGEETRSLFVVYSDGRMLDANGYDDKTIDFTQIDWYKKAISVDEPFFFYTKNLKTNKPDIFILFPLTNTDGKKIGMIGEVINNDILDKEMDQHRVNGKGYITLISDDFDFITHPNESLVGTNAKDIGLESAMKEAFKLNGKDVVQYKLNGITKYGISMAIPNSNIHVFATVSESELLFGARKVLIMLAISCLIVLILSLVIISILAHRITKPTSQVVKYVRDISTGDFTAENITTLENRNDEVGDIYRAILHLKENFMHILQNIQHTASVVNQSTEELTAVSTENAASMEEIGKACEAMANELTDFSASNQLGLEKLNDLNNAIINANDTVKDNVLIGVENSRSVGRDGVKNIEILLQKSETVEQLRQTIAEQINTVGQETAKLQDITKLIAEVSNRINLLSINALIQAAHIGGNNGFSVIAHEIRKLSDTTAEENKHIQAFIQNISVTVKQLLTESVQFTTEFKEQNEVILKTSDLFIHLKNSIDMVSNGLEVLASQVNIIEQNRSKVTEIITHNCDMSAEFSSSIEEITASVEQNAAALQSNLENIHTLEDKANDLNKETSVFKL